MTEEVAMDGVDKAGRSVGGAAAGVGGTEDGQDAAGQGCFKMKPVLKQMATKAYGSGGESREESAKVHGRTGAAESRIASSRLRERELVAPSNDADEVKIQFTEIVCGLAPSHAASTIALLYNDSPSPDS